MSDRRIYKKTINGFGIHHIDNCEEILQVGFQRKELQAWYIHNPDMDVPTGVEVYATGDIPPSGDKGTYLNTCISETGAIVVHVFVCWDERE